MPPHSPCLLALTAHSYLLCRVCDKQNARWGFLEVSRKTRGRKTAFSQCLCTQNIELCFLFFLVRDNMSGHSLLTHDFTPITWLSGDENFICGLRKRNTGTVFCSLSPYTKQCLLKARDSSKNGEQDSPTLIKKGRLNILGSYFQEDSKHEI